MKFSVGADPELFATRKNGNLVSVIGKFPGSKDEPYPIECGGAVQVDNVACEFNTVPATSPDEFSQAVSLPLAKVQELLALKKLKISNEAYVDFPVKELRSPMALLAGCDPDYCAYTGKTNVPPDFYSTTHRSAAGHVHVGVELSEEEVPMLVKALDLMLTIPALKYESAERRELYGKAGCFRRKPYGVEYRTPSNHWIFTEERRKWVFSCVENAVKNFKKVVLPVDLQDVINNNDLQRAEMLIEEYHLTPCPN